METLLDKNITKAITQGISYPEYRAFVKNQLRKGMSTGEKHTEELVNYTSLNDKRMDRLDKTIVLRDDVLQATQHLTEKYTWLLITEGWCGDAAQSVPVIGMIAANAPNIELKIILRDQYPEVMDNYLTNGGKSIPKLINFHQGTKEEVGTWGPRPKEAQEMVLQYKALENRPPYSEFVKDIQLWYAKNKTQSIQNELLELLQLHK